MINHEMKLVEDLFGPGIKRVSMRDGFGEGLVEAGKREERVVAVTADLKESTRVDSFATAFPERFFEVGVAEQNLAGVGAGLALSGLIPFCSSYAVFSPGRNWDQVRVSIAYSKASVKLVGSHAGLSVGPDGATHQALEDIALMRVLPNMTVISPADSLQARRATLALAEHEGPAYLRLCRAKTPVFTSEETSFEIGEAQVLRYGEGVTIVATGSMVYEALRAAKEVDGEVVNVHTIKPLDEKAILQSARKTKKVVTVEEHQVAGGLGGAVAELLSEKLPVPLRRIGVNDSFGESGEAEELLMKYGLTWERVVEEAKELME